MLTFYVPADPIRSTCGKAFFVSSGCPFRVDAWPFVRQFSVANLWCWRAQCAQEKSRPKHKYSNKDKQNVGNWNNWDVSVRSNVTSTKIK